MAVTHAVKNDKPTDEKSRWQDLPGWKDLSRRNERAATQNAAGGILQDVSTGRFVLLLVALVSGFTLYIGHVHATQELLTELQNARQENRRMHLKMSRLKGEFDRRTSPALIHRRARAMGLEEGIQYGPTIEVPE